MIPRVSFVLKPSALTSPSNINTLLLIRTKVQHLGIFFREQNTEADRLSHLKMTSKIPQQILSGICGIAELDPKDKYDFLLAWVQSRKCKTRMRNCRRLSPQFGTMAFDDYTIHTFDDTVVVAPVSNPE